VEADSISLVGRGNFCRTNPQSSHEFSYNCPFAINCSEFQTYSSRQPWIRLTPCYVRSSRITDHPEDITHANSRNRATDGAGAPSFYTTDSLSDLEKKCWLAADALESRMKPGDVIDLGRLRQGGASGYLCRMTATGDGYVVQTHEQAKTAPFSGLFLPAVNNPQGNTAIDMTPVTDVNQVPPQMYNILHSLARFTTRQPIEQLLMKT
jgi:hypothetical protein